ncbi:MAG: permease [Candidatus Thermoplasmatota archaeon]|nr:permease [Candidatus Thermoplasmatota archaeon]
MSVTAIFINLFALICFLYGVYRDKEKAVESLKKAVFSLFKILPTVLIIIVIIGLMLGFVPPSEISRFVGEQSGIFGVLLVGIVGSILHIPALVSFPLAASMLDSGATVTAVAAFITTLTMIGMVTLPLEIKKLGKKFALLRNGLSFIIAIIIALIMGVLL